MPITCTPDKKIWHIIARVPDIHWPINFSEQEIHQERESGISARILP
jgi:hypothetical protein